MVFSVEIHFEYSPKSIVRTETLIPKTALGKRQAVISVFIGAKSALSPVPAFICLPESPLARPAPALKKYRPGLVYFLDSYIIPCSFAQRCLGGEIGRRKGLKIPRWKHRAGSTPARGTNKFKAYSKRPTSSLRAGPMR
jgi:hypothetical protein